MTENPWVQLPTSGIDLIHNKDLHIVTYHNNRSKDHHKFYLEFVPEPYIGNINAPIIALNANPGYNPLEVKIHNDPTIRKIMLDNLNHNYSGFYYLSEEFNMSTGAVWWRKKLRKLVDAAGRDSVSKNLLVVESMAYHSKKFKFIDLPSQKYSCQLVKNAMDRNALVIIMRSEKIWYELVPALRTYKNLIKMSNPQQTYFSPGNLPRYNEVVEIIKGSA